MVYRSDCEHASSHAWDCRLLDAIVHRRIEYFRRIARLAEYVERNIERTPTLEELAGFVGMTPAALCRYVRQKIGLTPFELVRALRLGRAAQLLSESDESIGAVARRVGYRSLPTFSRAFKDAVGVSPATYRSAVVDEPAFPERRYA